MGRTIIFLISQWLGRRLFITAETIVITAIA